MAASSKKRDFDHNDYNDEKNTISKKRKLERVDENLNNFLDWCQNEGFIISTKVSVTKDGSCAQYGMVAVESIKEGETLFEIPRCALLMPDTSAIAQLLKEEKDQLKSESGWVQLLLALMYEYSNSNSRWHHYVCLVPDFEELNLPMFWSRDKLENELRGTGICEAVERDLLSMTDEFSSIVLPFVKKHSEIFQPICHNLEFYKKMVAFVMAYSFTEPANDDDSDDDSCHEGDGAKDSPPPMMVPMADILNHVSNNNAHLVFEKESLKMVATKIIQMGEEVYNTYGELANWQLLHMYGFSELPHNNIYNTVDLPMKDIFNVLSEIFSSELALFEQKWKFLKDIGCVSDDGAFVLGEPGILTEEAMFQTIRVLVMNEKDFEEHKQKEGWSSDDDDGIGKPKISESLTYSDITSLPLNWKDILLRITVTLIEKYPRTIEEEKKEREQSMQVWEKHQMYASNVRYGQLELLTKLKSVVSN